jgi:hypothetical protein
MRTRSHEGIALATAAAAIQSLIANQQAGYEKSDSNIAPQQAEIRHTLADKGIPDE